jgi:hypothetical protein
MRRVSNYDDCFRASKEEQVTLYHARSPFPSAEDLFSETFSVVKNDSRSVTIGEINSPIKRKKHAKESDSMKSTHGSKYTAASGKQIDRKEMNVEKGIRRPIFNILQFPGQRFLDTELNETLDRT